MAFRAGDGYGKQLVLHRFLQRLAPPQESDPPGCRPSRFPFEEPGGKTRLEADEVKRKGERMNNTAKTPEPTDKGVGFGRDSEKVKALRSAFQKNFSPLWPPQAVF